MTNPVSELRFDLPATDFFAPAAIQSMFWRPRFVTSSPVLGHVPFLFWLAGTVRPRRAAVLGAGDGVAHFALCQTMDKLNIPGLCLGLGFWAAPGEERAREAPQALREHAALLYDDLSELQASAGPAEALADLASDSLDLLFVDLGALPAGEPPQADDLLAPLCTNGILVLHGSRNLLPRSDLNSALAGRLSSTRRIEFSAGFGLTVAVQGEGHPQRLDTLLRACADGAAPGEIEMVFRRLGDGLHATVERMEVGAAEAEARRSLSMMKKKHEAAETTLRDLSAAYDARSHKLTEAQSALFDLEAERRQHFEETAALTRMLEKARAEAAHAAALERQIEEAQAEAATQRAEAEAQAREAAEARIEAERRQRFEETAALTRMLEEATEAVRKAEALAARRSHWARQHQETLAKERETARWRVGDMIVTAVARPTFGRVLSLPVRLVRFWIEEARRDRRRKAPPKKPKGRKAGRRGG